MNKRIKTAVMASLLALTSVASAQTVKNGQVSGTIITRSGIMAASAVANIYTTPAKGYFVITQFCTAESDVVLSGSTTGVFIALQAGCQTFNPGLAIPANETLTCYSTQAFTTHCLMTGVLSKT